jgi:hypothetical protein
MTEAEWLACSDPTAMLDFLRGKVSERKWRLLGCACCRRVWHLLSDVRHREAVAIAERLADGEATEEGARPVADASYSATFHRPATILVPGCRTICKGGAAHLLVRHLSSYDDWDETYRCPPLENTELAAAEVREPLRQRERAAQAALVRDVFGNPFRPISINRAWLSWNGDTILKMARAVYDDRAFDGLPILADALEDAGCTDAQILDHCRRPGEHVRGCWVVDALLGKG